MPCSHSLTNNRLLNALKLGKACNFTSDFITTDEDLDVDSNYYNILLNNPVNYHETDNLNLILPPTAINSPHIFMDACECKKPC